MASPFYEKSNIVNFESNILYDELIQKTEEEVEKTQVALEARIDSLKNTYRSTPIHVIHGIKAVTSQHKRSIHDQLKKVELNSFKRTWMSEAHWEKVDELLSK